MSHEHMPGFGPKNGHYRTSDLYYAAYLKVAGVTFVGTKRDGGRIYFLFESSDDGEALRDLKQSYYNRSSKVAALTYADEVKVMKALTHEGGE